MTFTFQNLYTKQNFLFNFKQIQDSFSTQHQIQIQIKMTESNHICDLWNYTIARVFKHDSKSKLGLMFKQWIIFNKLENFNSLLNYPIDDFTPSGNLCYMNEHGDILPYAPRKNIQLKMVHTTCHG